MQLVVMILHLGQATRAGPLKFGHGAAIGAKVDREPVAEAPLQVDAGQLDRQPGAQVLGRLAEVVGEAGRSGGIPLGVEALGDRIDAGQDVQPPLREVLGLDGGRHGDSLGVRMQPTPTIRAPRAISTTGFSSRRDTR
jgi:hypothetical protein